MPIPKPLFDQLTEFEKQGFSPDEIVQGMLGAEDKYPDAIAQVKKFQGEGYSAAEILTGMKSAPVVPLYGTGTGPAGPGPSMAAPAVLPGAPGGAMAEKLQELRGTPVGPGMPTGPEQERTMTPLGKGFAHGAAGLVQSAGGALHALSTPSPDSPHERARRRRLEAQGYTPEQIAKMRPAGEKLLRDAGQKMMDHWDKVAETLGPDQDIQGSIVKNPGLLKSPKWWAYNIGDMLPSTVATIAAAVFGGPAMAGVVGGGLEGVSTYESMVKSGESPENAKKAMVLMGTGTAVLNAVPFAAALGKVPGLKSGVAKYLTTSGMEGITEWLEEPWEAVSKGVATGKIDPEEIKRQAMEGLNVAPIAALQGLLLPGAMSLRADTGGKAAPGPSVAEASFDRSADVNLPPGAARSTEPGSMPPAQPVGPGVGPAAAVAATQAGSDNAQFSGPERRENPGLRDIISDYESKALAGDMEAIAHLREGGVWGDNLTPLLNKRGYEKLKPVLDTQPEHFWLDLDNFKDVNEKMTHAGGDKVIEAVGDILSWRMGELAARWGGDEFVGAGTGLAERLEEVRDMLANLEVPYEIPAGTEYPKGSKRILDKPLVVVQNGIRLSFGVGKSQTEAYNANDTNKQERAQAGLRYDRNAKPADAGRVGAEPSAGNEVSAGQAAAGSRGGEGQETQVTTPSPWDDEAETSPPATDVDPSAVRLSQYRNSHSLPADFAEKSKQLREIDAQHLRAVTAKVEGGEDTVGLEDYPHLRRKYLPENPQGRRFTRHDLWLLEGAAKSLTSGESERYTTENEQGEIVQRNRSWSSAKAMNEWLEGGKSPNDAAKVLNDASAGKWPKKAHHAQWSVIYSALDHYNRDGEEHEGYDQATLESSAAPRREDYAQPATPQKSALEIIQEKKRPPVPEEESEPEQSEPSGPETLDTAAQRIIDGYEDTGELTRQDVVDQIEALAEDSNDDRAGDLLEAVEAYRSEQQEDYEEHGMRGDMDAAFEQFMESVRAAINGPREAAATAQANIEGRNGSFSERMARAKTANDGRIILAQMTDAINALERSLGYVPSVGSIDGKLYRGFSVVHPKVWTKRIADAKKADPAAGRRLEELVNDGAETERIWQERYVGGPEDNFPPLRESGRREQSDDFAVEGRDVKKGIPETMGMPYREVEGSEGIKIKHFLLDYSATLGDLAALMKKQAKKARHPKTSGFLEAVPDIEDIRENAEVSARLTYRLSDADAAKVADAMVDLLHWNGTFLDNLPKSARNVPVRDMLGRLVEYHKANPEEARLSVAFEKDATDVFLGADTPGGRSRALEIIEAKKRGDEVVEQPGPSNPGPAALAGLEQDIPRDVAVRAFEGTSFSPEKRGEARIKEYIETMESDYDELDAMADTPEKREYLDREFPVYRKKYRDKFMAYLYAHGRVVSSMIAGPAKFPAERMRKRSDSADRRANEAMEFRKKAFERMRREVAPPDARGPIRSDDPEALTKLREKLQALKERQEHMKAVNTAHKKYLKVGEKALEGLSDDDRRLIETYKPPYSWEPHPFAPYQLSNNNANIKQVEQRIKQLEAAAGDATAEAENDGIRVVDNVEDGRLQIFFPDKPDGDTISKLKKRGFRWSPSVKAWQRFRSPAANDAAKEITGIDISTPSGSVAESHKSYGTTPQYIRDALNIGELDHSLTMSDQVKDYAKREGIARGAILLDAKLRPILTVAVPADLKKLRGAEQSRLMREFHRRNAVAWVLYDPTAEVAEIEAANLKAFSNTAGVNLLDIFDKSGSFRDSGSLGLVTDSMDFFSFPGNVVRDVFGGTERVVGKAMQKFFEWAGEHIKPEVKQEFAKYARTPNFYVEEHPAVEPLFLRELDRVESRHRDGRFVFAPDPDTGYAGVEAIIKLNRDEIGKLSEILVAGDRKKKRYTEDDLREAGTADRVVSAYLAARDMIERLQSVEVERSKEIALVPYEDDRALFDKLQRVMNDLVEITDEAERERYMSRLFHEQAAVLDAQTQKALSRLQKHVDTIHDRMAVFEDNPGYIPRVRDEGAFHVRALEHVLTQDESKTLMGILSYMRKARSRYTRKQVAEKFNPGDTVLDAFDEALELMDDDPVLSGFNRAPEEVRKALGRVVDKVSVREVWMEPAATYAQAKLLKAKVEAEPDKHFPANYFPGGKYEFTVKENTRLPEEIYADIGNPAAREAILQRAITNAQAKGTIAMADAEGISDALLQALKEETLKRGGGRSRISRHKSLIEGYKTKDIDKVLVGHVTGQVGYLTKALYSVRALRDMEGVTNPQEKRWAHQFYKNTLKNSTALDQAIGKMRAVAVLWRLGGVAKAAVMNSFQQAIIGQAELSRYTKSPALQLATAEKDVLTGKLSEWDKKVLEEGIGSGITEAQYMREIVGATDRGPSRGFFRAVDESMKGFGWVESEMNRKPALLAAMRLFTGAKKADGTYYGVSRDGKPYRDSYSDAMAKAKKFVRATHFEISKANEPEVVQGTGGVVRGVYTFQSYTANYLNWIFNRARHGEVQVLSRMLLASWALGGLLAMPFADELDEILTKMFGVSVKMKLRGLIRDLLRKDGGGVYSETVEDVIMHGLPAALGVDMTKSVQVNTPLPIALFLDQDRDFGEKASGAIGGLAVSAGRAVKSAVRGDYGRALEHATPNAIGNILRGLRLYRKGSTTSSGRPITDESGGIIRATGYEAGARALGFQPTRLSKNQELNTYERNLREHWSDRRQRILDAYRLSGGSDDLLDKIDDFNKDLLDSPEASALVPPIRASSIIEAVKGRVDKRDFLFRQEMTR